MNTKKIAQAVKDHLIDLAINDKLPLDMTQLSRAKLEKVIIAAMPSDREKAIELAGHYLCEGQDEGDLTVEQQVELIANHKNENEIIDYIDGVDVWQKVEFSFTCEQFLSEIGY